MNTEKRQYKRAIFTIEEGVVGRFLFLNTREKPLSGHILNLCVVGMYTAMPVANAKIPQKGDHIVLLQIINPPSMKFFLNIDMNVKWVFNPPDMEYVGIGCEFINTPKISRE